MADNPVLLSTRSFFASRRGKIFPLSHAYPTDEWEFEVYDFKEIRCLLCRKRHILLSLREALGWGLLKVNPEAALTTAERSKKWKERQQKESPLQLVPPPTAS